MISSTALTAVLLVASGFAAFLSLFFILQRRTRGSRELAALMASCSVYAFGYAFELGTRDLQDLMRWIRLEYLGIPFIPYFWLLFALAFSRGRSLKALPALALAVIPLVTLALVRVDQFLPLLYSSVGLRYDGPFPTFAPGRGPWYYVNSLYAYSSFSAGVIILIRHARGAPPERRAQARLVVAGAMVPILGNAGYLLGLTPWGLDPGPFALVVLGSVFAFVVFRYRLVELAPIAREAVFESMQDCVLVLDRRGRLEGANAAARRTLNLSEGTVGMPLVQALPGRVELATLAAAGEGACAFSLAGSGDAPSRFQASAFPARDGRGRIIGTILVLRDVTEVEDLLERLRLLASTDELTGADNRRRFFEHASREMERARRHCKPIAAILLDLDRFKEVNDRHGHAAGDAVLREVSARFRGELRTGDFFCRYGGEEFAALLPDTDEEGAVILAERLRAALNGTPVMYLGQPMDITASFGAAGLVPKEAEALDALLREADLALYRAKDLGRNRVEGANARGQKRSPAQ